MKRIALLIASTAAIAGSVIATASAGATSSASSLPVLTLTMDGKSIKVGGSTQSGAVTVSSVVSSKAAAPILVKLAPGVTFAKAFGSVAQHHGDPNYLSGLAAITYSNETAPRGTSSAQTLLTPGNYVALDTTNNNPAKWPSASFTVTTAAAPAALPTPAATVKAIDFNFAGPTTLHRGTLVRFENDGFVIHMIDAFKVKNMTLARRAKALLLAGKDNQAQKLAQGFVSFMGPASTGAVQQEVVTAKPGIYVLACFMDTQDGREHTRLGMEKIIRVK
jgi:hypothetical protein